jgi:hypothetical protein
VRDAPPLKICDQQTADWSGAHARLPVWLVLKNSPKKIESSPPSERKSVPKQRFISCLDSKDCMRFAISHTPLLMFTMFVVALAHVPRESMHFTCEYEDCCCLGDPWVGSYKEAHE